MKVRIFLKWEKKITSGGNEGFNCALISRLTSSHVFAKDDMT